MSSAVAFLARYGRYIMDVIDRYLREGKRPDIHMLVLYTADSEEAQTVMERRADGLQHRDRSILSGVGVDSGQKETPALLFTG